MTFGQPPDTASMSFEGSRSMVWVMESLTAGPLGSSSIVQSDSPSALSSGLSWCCQRITNRRGGSAATISPASDDSAVGVHHLPGRTGCPLAFAVNAKPVLLHELHVLGQR